MLQNLEIMYDDDDTKKTEVTKPHYTRLCSSFDTCEQISHYPYSTREASLPSCSGSWTPLEHFSCRSCGNSASLFCAEFRFGKFSGSPISIPHPSKILWSSAILAKTRNFATEHWAVMASRGELMLHHSVVTCECSWLWLWRSRFLHQFWIWASCSEGTTA